MDVINRFDRPTLRRPRAVMAFEGWNDACESATGAVEYLLEEADVTEPFAVIDPEEFFDFQVRRPVVSIGDGGTRSLSWPTTKFFAVERPGEAHDLVVVLGEEPSFRWRTFCRSITRVLVESDVEDAVLLGAFVGQVAHTRPVPVIGVASEPEMVLRHGLLGSTYEGPTGIVGVLQEACREIGLPTMSLWAATPHYLSANPNPKASLALLRHTVDILGIAADLDELEESADEFEERVTEAMESSGGDLSDYINGLEDDNIDGPAVIDPGQADELLSEIEQFLQDRE